MTSRIETRDETKEPAATAGAATPREWTMAKAEMAGRAAIDRIAPVHLRQADGSPRPDDCVYRYEAAEVVASILAAAESAILALPEWSNEDWREDGFGGNEHRDIITVDRAAVLAALTSSTPEKP